MAWMLQVGQGILDIAGAENQKTAEKYNEMVQQEDAEIARMRGQINVQEVERQSRFQEGAARAGYAGSGVTMTGSPMDELANQAIGDNFKKEVAYFNGLVNVGADEAAAGMSDFLGRQYQTAGYLSGGGQIADTLISKFYSPDDKTSKDSQWGGIPYG